MSMVLPKGLKDAQRSAARSAIRADFARAALQGILANPSEQMVNWDEEKVAYASVQHADALLAELEKSNGTA